VISAASRAVRATCGLSGGSALQRPKQSANITLLGNYMASAFITAGDGVGGTLVLDQTDSTPQLNLAAPPGAS
jgi:hypothetical protein